MNNLQIFLTIVVILCLYKFLFLRKTKNNKGMTYVTIDSKDNDTFLRNIVSKVVEKKPTKETFTDSDSSEEIEVNKIQVVLCYSNSCNHCVIPAQYFRKLMKETYTNFEFGMVESYDLHNYPEMEELIYGYPTIFIIKDGVTKMYSGPRDKVTVFAHLNRYYAEIQG
jgi:hypothetical protein